MERKQTCNENFGERNIETGIGGAKKLAARSSAKASVLSGEASVPLKQSFKTLLILQDDAGALDLK